MSRFFIYSIFFLAFVACKKENKTVNDVVTLSEKKQTIVDSVVGSEEKINFSNLFKVNSDFISNGFDFPVGKPNAHSYYNAQKFQENNHLGDDWNGINGGNTDLGDPIYSAANGYISEVKDYEGGWGLVVKIIHLHNKKLYQSIYAHCDTVLVAEGSLIKKGEQLATIGNCNGYYLAHLHFEIRDDINLDIGAGYSLDTSGYLDPTDFINKNRN
jgi:murein DD-endopeptidase MepM/ murein hydrolase activator NlpD